MAGSGRAGPVRADLRLGPGYKWGSIRAEWVRDEWGWGGGETILSETRPWPSGAGSGRVGPSRAE